MLEYIAATELADPKKASVASAGLEKLEAFQALPALRKELGEAVESSTQNAEFLKGVNRDVFGKLRDYGLWLEENGDPFSPSEEERKEGRRLRRDICELTALSKVFESSLKKEIESVRRLEKEIDALFKKVRAELDALDDKFGVPKEDESSSESEDMSGDEYMSERYVKTATVKETVSVEPGENGVSTLPKGANGSFESLDEFGVESDEVEVLGRNGMKAFFEWPDDAF